MDVDRANGRSLSFQIAWQISPAIWTVKVTLYFFKLPRFDQIRPGGGDRSGFGALNGDRYGPAGR
jgi:hypothetical protein